MKETRICAVCSQEFRVNITSIRKTCCTEHSRIYNDEMRRKYNREYQQRPEVKERTREYQREYHKRRGEKQ